MLRNELHIDEINLFIGKNFLITVSGNNSDERRPLGCGEYVESDPKNAKAGPDFLMHSVLDHLVDEKFKAFDKLEDDLEEAEESLIGNVEKFQPMQLIHLRKILLALRKGFITKGRSLSRSAGLTVPLSVRRQLYITGTSMTTWPNSLNSPRHTARLKQA